MPVVHQIPTVSNGRRSIGGRVTSGVDWEDGSVANAVRLSLTIIDYQILLRLATRIYHHLLLMLFWLWSEYVLFADGRSLRDIPLNDLTGTIPPQLGNLTQLRLLYAHCLNRIVLVDIEKRLSLMIHHQLIRLQLSIRSVPFSQADSSESVQWHHPSSARQSHSVENDVRS